MSYANYATTGLQEEVGKALDEGETPTSYAKRNNLDNSTICKIASKLKARAAKKGYAPDHDMTKTVPDGYAIKGTSTLYDEDGKPRLQWVKTNQDAERQLELMRETVESLSKDIKPCPPVTPPSQILNSDLCNLYTLTDCHVGMLAWIKEGGAEWNLEIAEDILVRALIHMMDNSPKAETCIVGELGDFEHFDSFDAVTPAHGHILDASGRFSQVIDVSLRIRRRWVHEALKRHKKVICLIAEGNHNPKSSMFMRKMFAALYENEPRVTVIESEIPYYAYKFGDAMIGWHHGHKKKKEALPILFASQFPEIWGATKVRHIHTGHQHHLDIKEHSGVTVYQHRTIAARDAHTSHGGYLSEREVDCMTYHKEHGHVATNIVKPSMLT